MASDTTRPRHNARTPSSASRKLSRSSRKEETNFMWRMPLQCLIHWLQPKDVLRCSLVCKAWKAALAVYYWQSVHSVNFGPRTWRTVQLPQIRSVLRLSPHLLHVILDYRTVHACPYGSCNVNVYDMLQLVRNLPRTLKTLSLRNWALEPRLEPLSDDKRGGLVGHWQPSGLTLREQFKDRATFKNFTLAVLELLGAISSLPELQTVCLPSNLVPFHCSSSCQPTPRDLLKLVNGVAELLNKHPHPLLHLQTSIFCDQLATLVPAELQVLRIDNVTPSYLSDAGLKSLSGRCPLLRELWATEFPLTTSAVTGLVKACPSLEVLCVEPQCQTPPLATTSSLLAALAALPNLQFLSLSGWRMEDGPEPVAECIGRLTRLQALALANIQPEVNCDSIVQAAAEHCPGLTALQLCYVHISAASWRALGQAGRLRYLRAEHFQTDPSSFQSEQGSEEAFWLLLKGELHGRGAMRRYDEFVDMWHSTHLTTYSAQEETPW
eukprot:CAMPEP_0118941810 /NCGR_PEP_ID=MMETSP1169-20130426/34723_1 /TAXON_ID=36882 /ORGANISM="Pyramimonas obovata, Strain CCMP722" /LENGTH=493 /DNA_ID=CAMNT_0006886665 /DNA_START=277 /DNA_END=1755 /DNA_ORIENTATION=+